VSDFEKPAISYNHLAVPHPALYKLSAFVTKKYLNRHGGLTYSGVENLENSGPLVVAPRHWSLWDIPAVSIAALEGAGIQMYGMAKQELMSNWLTRWYLTSTGAISVVRSETLDEASQPETEEQIAEVMDANGVICVYPDGTRLGEINPEEDPRKFKRGALIIALKHGATIIPTGVSGTTASKLKDDLPAHVHYGRGLAFEKLAKDLMDDPRKIIQAVKPHRAKLHDGLVEAQRIADISRLNPNLSRR
jgi:1-acyl-sn-glycerol-3-phosphate acyltransferase